MIKSLHNSRITTQKSSTCYDDFGETFWKSRKDLHWSEIDLILDNFLQEFIPTTWILADIGCGNGRLLKHIMKHPESNVYKNIFSTFVGLDRSHILLEQARTDDAVNHFFPSINWREGDMTNIWKELSEFGLFDGIFFIASFHHLVTFEERLDVLSQAKKLLSAGAKILMINWNLLHKSQTKYADSQIAKYPDWSADYKIKIGSHLRFYHSFSSEEYSLLAQQSWLTILRESFLERNSILILQ